MGLGMPRLLTSVDKGRGGEGDCRRLSFLGSYGLAGSGTTNFSDFFVTEDWLFVITND